MRNRLVYGAVFIVLIALDQITKIAAAAFLHLGESREIMGNVLRLTYVRNPDGAFSLSFGGPHVMFAVNIAIIILLACLFIKGTIRPETFAGKVALSMVFAGAAGNFVDRIRMGEVIDFIDMGIGSHRWPVYNVADIAITFGMILLFFTYSRQGVRTEPRDVAV